MAITRKQAGSNVFSAKKRNREQFNSEDENLINNSPRRLRSACISTNEGGCEEPGRVFDRSSKLNSSRKWLSRCTSGSETGNLEEHCNESLNSPEQTSKLHSPVKLKSPCKDTNREQNKDSNENHIVTTNQSNSPKKWKSPSRSIVKGENNVSNEKLFQCSPEQLKWNPRGEEFWNDSTQMHALKEAFHVSKSPSTILCRDEEQGRVLEFCKTCIKQEKAGSLYICGCPGTGKSLSIEKVKDDLIVWAKEVGCQSPDILSINCTLLGNASEIFHKLVQKSFPLKKINVATSPLQHLQKMFSKKKQPSHGKMIMMIADEMDYLIFKDRAVLHELFMLTTYPFSRLILLGIANAIDLAHRFLPKLQSFNCNPVVVTFRAYSKDQILKILHQRLKDISYDDVFQPLVLELCARKVAAACGDMRNALNVCRTAIEMLESELIVPDASANSPSGEKQYLPRNKEVEKVRVDHMAKSLSKIFKSAVHDTIQSLPQHQQVILCSIVTFFRQGRKDTSLGQLNKLYLEACKTAQIPAASMQEFSNMCQILNDQGLLKLGQSKEEKLKRVTLNVDEADVAFALKVQLIAMHLFILAIEETYQIRSASIKLY